MPTPEFSHHRDDFPTSAHPPSGGERPRAEDFLGNAPGDVIGHYQLVSVLGEGGFGVVWLALQREPMVRQVALKVLKPGMESREVLARFEQERQVLALLDHPCVAKVFDAGATRGGRPYFAMELVRGVAITAYADAEKLDLASRLELFVPVCEAVQHAHTKGIIHRDLKPSNVLVEVVDGKATPKVIDFGVAKAIEHTLTDKTLFTQAGQIVGTPEYMSPEQADADHARVDTRTDVYALGVMLYELLTGVLPFEPAELRSAGYREIQRVIREDDPPRPSTRLSSLGARATEAAMNRRTRAGDLTSVLRRELEWVPLKAMRKVPAARYQSAAELAQDVRAYLSGKPLSAGPESRVYRARKFVRRNRVGVAFAATLTCAGIVGVGALAAAYAENRRAYKETVRAGEQTAFALQESRRAEREVGKALEASRVAERESRLAFERVRRVSAFLSDVLVLADPNADRRWVRRNGGDWNAENVTVRAAVEAASRRVDAGELAGEPLVEADVREVIGEAFAHFGLTDRATTHLTKALELRDGAGGGMSADMLRAAHTRTQLAGVQLQQGEYALAAETLVAAIENLRSSSDAPAGRVGETVRVVAKLCQHAQMYEQARDMFSKARELFLMDSTGGTGGTRSPHHAAEVTVELGVLEYRLGRAERAAELLEDGSRRLRTLYGEESTAYAQALIHLGSALRGCDKFDESERTLRDAAALWERLTPSGSPALTVARGTLGRLLVSRQKYAEAMPIVQKVLEEQRGSAGTGGVRSLPLAETLDDYGLLLRASGKLDEAIAVYREALSIRERVQGVGHLDTATLMVALADTLTQGGRAGEALEYARRAVELRAGALPAEHWGIFSARSVLGGVLIELGEFQEAEGHLLAAEQAFTRSTGGNRKRLTDTLERLVKLYELWNKPEQAAIMRERLRKMNAESR